MSPVLAVVGLLSLAVGSGLLAAEVRWRRRTKRSRNDLFGPEFFQHFR